MKKTKIIIFIDWFLPGFKAGGPIISISNFINQLSNDFEISVVTSDRDFRDKNAYRDINTGVWIKKKNFRIMYLKNRNQNIITYNDLLNEKLYDYIYLNSLFSLKFTLYPLLIAKFKKIKIVLAPRGMLGKGALKIKYLKKKAFILLLRLTRIFSTITWQATSISEASNISYHFGKNANVKLVSNLSSHNKLRFEKKHKKKNKLNLFFLSRISKKKNLHQALIFLKQIENKYKINFSLIGPIEDESYWNKCKLIISKLPKNIKVDYLGPVPNHELSVFLKKFHVLLFPTLNENYGHVIIESLQFGNPVIISNNTPWSNLKRKKIGFDIDLNNTEDFIGSIIYFAKMHQDTFNIWSKNSFDYAKQIQHNEQKIKQYQHLFIKKISK